MQTPFSIKRMGRREGCVSPLRLPVMQMGTRYVHAWTSLTRHYTQCPSSSYSHTCIYGWVCPVIDSKRSEGSHLYRLPARSTALERNRRVFILHAHRKGRGLCSGSFPGNRFPFEMKTGLRMSKWRLRCTTLSDIPSVARGSASSQSHWDSAERGERVWDISLKS